MLMFFRLCLRWGDDQNGKECGTIKAAMHIVSGKGDFIREAKQMNCAPCADMDGNGYENG